MIYLKNLKELTVDGIKLVELYINNILVWKSGIKNWVRYAIDTDGSLYEGTGYIEGYRLNSSGGLSAQDNTVTTGFIPCKPTDVIRMANAEWNPLVTVGGYNYLSFYNKSFGLLGSVNVAFTDGAKTVRGIVKSATSITVSDGVATFKPEFSDGSEVAYFRINGYGIGARMLVTVNEEIQFAYKNWVKYSTTEDGKTIYNGGMGYKNGYRIRSGGAEGTNPGTTCTGFIPVKSGDVVRISGCNFSHPQNGNAINVSDSSFTNIGQFTTLPAHYGIFADGAAYHSYSFDSVVEEKTGVWKWVVPPAASGVAYIRVSGYSTQNFTPGANLIVTINEEIA